ncbi:MAG TPA: hypothetical protein VMG08_14725 [Allosphingosinicella sp.]|nr:hypothetical protein [Allosphingosinicella sp.]
MYPSSSTCRAQEAYHRDRAVQTPLENVRLIAERAAAAWGLEGAAAERREARQVKVRLVADAALAQKQQTHDELSRLANENPDRVFEEQ